MKNCVMVIEDEPVIAEMISIILEEQGFEVISLGDTSWAREKLHGMEADIVMLDLKLKGEGGKSICKYIKSKSDLKHIPVILVSGNNDLEKIKKECGADDFIKKPFDLDTLIAKVNAYAIAS